MMRESRDTLYNHINRAPTRYFSSHLNLHKNERLDVDIFRMLDLSYFWVASNWKKIHFSSIISYLSGLKCLIQNKISTKSRLNFFASFSSQKSQILIGIDNRVIICKTANAPFLMAFKKTWLKYLNDSSSYSCTLLYLKM